MSHAPGPPPGPFRIPAFKEWFPRKAQPWVYVLLAISFQLSGGRYLGALNYMVGEESLMREDLLMALYANLAGMATFFPLLFRMKFRFTNKNLLIAAALGVALTNLLIPHVNFLPLLCLLCFIEGICKLEGTFEALSTIQLWITPKRDFRVFFPVLHLFIMGSLNLASWLVCYFAFGWDDWRLMHWLISGGMLCIVLFLVICTRQFRIFPKTLLWGIDWTGYLLWNALILQIANLCGYGDWREWYDSPTTWTLTGTILLTAGLIAYGMRVKPHAFIPRKVFWFRNVVPILLLITLFEVLAAAERVLEEVFLEEGLHYTDWSGANRHLVAIVGCWAGCAFAYWWLKVRGWGYLRLGIAATVALLAYLVQMYFIVDPGLSREMLYPAIFCRGFAGTVMSIMLMTCLNASMDFHTFFQGLSAFNMLHLVMGGSLGSAIYAKLFNVAVGDAFARHTPWLNEVSFTAAPFDLGHFMEGFSINMLLVGVKICYGWACYGSIALLLLFLIYDSPVRHYRPHVIPTWRSVGQRFFRPFLRKSKVS